MSYTDLTDPIYPLKPQRIDESEVEAAIEVLERYNLLIVKRDDTGHVRWFTLASGSYADDELTE